MLNILSVFFQPAEELKTHQSAINCFNSDKGRLPKSSSVAIPLKDNECYKVDGRLYRQSSIASKVVETAKVI